ncbi:glutamine--fructose-6-phosphate transaminase (isomerizing) [Kroppenstedtia eburnea]|uniref:Glutamine--fructose-6-phosphate aminotransferase [isomerizing] n=1 Tax=Kroppenstedtia eburnea TaxID=714067 RepID=A0A1N7P7K9_9BACL|nr:glutamine--fructose-6-phosphate transaminase (isomerizing) [Kroppenstedtia eburnea]QKI80809.1 glutamine--fructose-6-phosphate transaminase (isomerizing) [Kroppenstedtia eburnea]SIT06518.1 glucosamine--fructose-6-phosphate aminotransferase (isomerizing) [Kroppenstedtia eburnea]
MCGIVGYIGSKQARDILVKGLRKLEYRGYDSAGIALYREGKLESEKTEGPLTALEKRLQAHPLTGHLGIGHTRWATHGKPSDENAHPHLDRRHQFAVVHNGIIENYLELKEELQNKGVTFTSETDTEVIAHLLADLDDGDLVSTVRRAVRRMRGAYALAVISREEPDKMVAVRLASPLIIGVGGGENFIASDIPAILEHTRDVYVLEDGEMAVLTREWVELTTIGGDPVDKELFHVTWDAVTAEKGGYDHFMQKEIFEQPRAIRDTLAGRMKDGVVDLSGELSFTEAELKEIDRIHLVACGTAYHTGLVGKTILEKWTRIPVEVDVASEYRYRDPLITSSTLVIVISQSGETADTLAALREAKKGGAKVLGITNVVGSSVAREADQVLMTWAGPEIAVASTKAYTTQLVALALLGLHLARAVGSLGREELSDTAAALLRLPEQADSLLADTATIERFARRIAGHEDLFFMGRGLDHAVVMEGSLKLKEISYIHSEACAAGELKHGTLALIEEGIPVIALATQQAVRDKMASNIIEVKARGAHVLGLALEGDTQVGKAVDELLTIPATLPLLTPVLAVIPLQLLAYHASVARGLNVDKPRNLAKSVTVE